MPDNQGNLFLYEAIELRAEYQARIASLKEILPEKQKSAGRGFLKSSEDERREPVADFDPGAARETIRKLEYKARKLNNAVQQVNFGHKLTVGGETMSIAEALDLRKSVGNDLASLQKMLEQAAYRRLIYKEERDIVEEPDARFTDVAKDLEERRLLFRRLNRALRKASFEVTVPFADEK